MELGFSVEDGQVQRAVVYSDAMDCELIEDLAGVLQDIPFRRQAVIDGVGALATGERKALVQDLQAWIGSLHLT